MHRDQKLWQYWGSPSYVRRCIEEKHKIDEALAALIKLGMTKREVDETMALAKRGAYAQLNSNYVYILNYLERTRLRKIHCLANNEQFTHDAS